MTDLTHGINPYQSVEGMVHDYEKKVAQEEAELHDPDVIDTPRSQMDVSREGENWWPRADSALRPAGRSP
jgi:hypothetical protein